MKVSELQQLFDSNNVIMVDSLLINKRTPFDPEVNDDEVAVSFNQPGVEVGDYQDFDYNFTLGDLKKAKLVDGFILDVNDEGGCPLLLAFYSLTPVKLS